MKPNITLKKIAETLNLSISTVSRALKDHPDISAETKAKVHDLAGMLEYDPNPYAINLRTSNSKEFAVIVPAISNFFYHSFLTALEEEATRYGYAILIYRSNDDPGLEAEILKRCRQKRVSGIFVSITARTEEVGPFLKLEEQGIPLIFFDKVPRYEACNQVCVADTAAAVLAAEALVRRRKTRILSLFGNAHMSITQQRLKAYTGIFQQAGAGALIVEHADSSLEAEQRTLRAFSGAERPDAVFCMSDEILVGVMKAVQKLRLSYPQQAGVVAISDGFIPQLYYPEISYAETSGFKLGKLAFSRMLSCLAGSTFVQHLTIDSVFIDGGSL
ncbi:LacI family DNA-binding transcriptional regulator [Paraflavisolibacter sp. H34]|uniref:LacI family DNA-binding transcriptional regulator n=1 Tax=Huijunlia imazamoxiresistens TaxID=3127457 RepID=UPI00301935D6